MKTKLFKFTIILLLLLFSLGWIDSTDVESYLPLKDGKVWEYESLNLQGDKVIKRRKLTVTNMASREFEGKNVIPVKYLWRETQFSSEIPFYFYFFVKSNDSIYAFAKQSEKDIQPIKLDNPLTYIKLPIKQDNKWIDSAAESIIESIDENITVPAGSFKCLRIKQTLKGGISITVWYARDVGRVKQLLQSKNEKLLIQLLKYNKS